MSTGKKLLLAFGLALLLAGCASAPKPDASSFGEGDQAPGLMDKVLEKLGLAKPDTEKMEAKVTARRIRWQLHASDGLNLNARGEPVALVTRIYKLKQVDAFLKAPYEAFGDSAKEKELFGEDLIESRDLQLIPGQHHDAIDKAPRDTNFVGIVALFRAPAPYRWRYAFKANSAEAFGLSLGLHACTMTVRKGDPIGDSVEAYKSAGIPCPQVKPTAAKVALEGQP